MNEARIDKWMWAVRIFKTRTIAAEACKKGRISINGALAKASRMVKPGMWFKYVSLLLLILSKWYKRLRSVWERNLLPMLWKT